MKQRFAILLFLLFSTSMTFASTNFEDTYGIPAGAHFSSLADQVVDTRFDESSMTLRQKFNRLKNLQLRIDSKLKEFSDDPIIWFLSGLNHNNLAEIQYLLVVEKSGQQMAASDIDVSNYSISRSRAYDNAIRLDSSQPYKLSSSIYATMSYGLSNRQKITTYRRELELGNPAENESNEYFMHWAKIDLLVQEKKLDEAQQSLKELEQLLKQRNKSGSAYSSIVERAKYQLVTELEISEKRKAVSLTSRQSSTKFQEAGHKPWGWKIWLLTGFGIFIFTFVLIAAIYLRKT